MTDILSRLSAALASQYAIERELGRGGMATVYLARDLKHHRRVALKVMRPELTMAVGADRFLREIQIAAQLEHPHIVPVFDSGEADGFLYYVMPHVVGESLRSRLSREGQLPVADAVDIACEVANALAYAHGQGIVHRDIKPENILLAQGHVRVADFGIARAVSEAAATTDDRLTGAGLALGTPLYMSPEQAAGHLRLDGRADVYSLGCVLYEMLAGEPPFSGPTPQSVIIQHAQNSAPPLGSKRRGLPAQVEQAVTKALHKLPADRFASAADFAVALPHHATPGSPTVPSPARKERWHPHVSRAGWALIGAVTLAGVLTATAFHRRAAPTMDASLYMVLPFRHRAQSAPMLLNGDQCESLLHDALGRWRGVQMVDPLWVADARSRRGRATSIEDGVAIARERRAGRVVLGEVWQFQDTIYVRGLLYDAGGGRLVREQSVRIAPDLSDAQIRFQELADSLLIGGGLASGAPPRGGGKLSLPAWHAFQDGYAALQRWDLDSAKVKLRRALAIDPTYAMAQLWLAQVLAWSGDEAKSWRSLAAGALASGDSLAPRDRGVAEGMLALAESRFPDACEKFRGILARDSLDFAAWFGLGECQGKDPLVVRDSSDTGWQFRGSYQAAVNAYRRALEIVPSVHLAFKGEAYSRLPDLLYTETNHIRRGYALTPDTVRFGARPSMSRDTLEFVPLPLAKAVSAQPGTIPVTVSAAVDRNRELMREIATTWVRAFPNRPDAHETLALVLETLGELTAGRSKDFSALSEVRRGRATATDKAQRLRLANIEIRFLVKSEQMAAARILADSVLRANPNPVMDDARQLRGLAALTGHVHLAAQLQRRAAPDYTFRTPNWEEVTVPLQLTDAALGLFAYSTFGTPMDSLVALERRVERLIPSYVEPAMRERARQAMLDLPAVFAFPERGAGPMHRLKAGGNYRLIMQWKLARGDTAGLREDFARLREVQRDIRPGDVSFDGTYHEAWLLLAIGDTAEATHLLDLSLDALPTLGTDLIDQLPEVATLVRGMALRAELAAHAGDSTVSHRWANNVVLLWSNADGELQPLVKRMRELAASQENRPT
jgi:tRNA A-37 threonylcarbamoyl transferase component Bud32/tetratricopeptide (TPR) repeat protein